MIARGAMLGPDQPVILHMLDIEPAAESLKGVKMELIDAAFPLLKGMMLLCLSSRSLIDFKSCSSRAFVNRFGCVFVHQELLLPRILLKLAKVSILQLWLVDSLGRKEWKGRM